MKTLVIFIVLISLGSYSIAQFDATGLASGVYVYRLTAGAWTAAKKMVVTK
jgi:hypothetical protein